MKKIETLVEDIYDTLANGSPSFSTIGNRIGDRIANSASRGLQPRKQSVRRDDGGIYFSNYSHKCPRSLWHKHHNLESIIPVNGSGKLRFLFGDIIEDMVLELAHGSGHSVTDEQRWVSIGNTRGRVDAVIDGVVCDVKSASPTAFRKFNDGLGRKDDTFGYLGQLKGYLHCVRLGQIEAETNRGGFLVVNRSTGEIALDIHEFSDDEIDNVPAAIEHTRRVVTGEQTPERAFEAVPEGKSGNLALQFECQHCPAKHACWGKVRTFEYKYNNFTKYVDLVHVEREPRVKEVTIQNDDD